MFLPLIILGAFLIAGHLSAAAPTVNQMLGFLKNYNIVSPINSKSFNSIVVRTGPIPDLWILLMGSIIQLLTQMWLAESIVSCTIDKFQSHYFVTVTNTFVGKWLYWLVEHLSDGSRL